MNINIACYICRKEIGNTGITNAINVQLDYEDHLMKSHGQLRKEAAKRVKFSMTKQIKESPSTQSASSLDESLHDQHLPGVQGQRAHHGPESNLNWREYGN